MKQKNRLASFIEMLSLALLCGWFPGCITSQPPPSDNVTVSDIINMSRSGESPSEIIGLIQDSGTVYRLSASQLANLRDRGVSDPVINYMQQTYLDAVRRDAHLLEERYWTPHEDYYYYRFGTDSP